MSNQFSQFNEQRQQLASLIRRSTVAMSDLSLDKVTDRLQNLLKRVDNDSFKIQIVGTFKNGKSTFINALLGEDILPAKALPCTAVINEIKYGPEKKAILHFRNPLPSTLIDTIPGPTLEHMKKHGMANIPPMEIEYDHMDKYVTIPTEGDANEISAASPYESVELFYPSPLLKDGVEIVDSPGLNECDERTKVTLEYLKKADAIIFLLNANQLCSEAEMDMITGKLVPMGFEEMFFVVNRIDIVPAKERREVADFAVKKVGKYTTNQIFCVSAKQALLAKTKYDKDEEENLSEEECEKLMRKSGFEPMEATLTKFLTEDKGKLKLARPSREIINIIRNEVLHNYIPAQRAMYNGNLDMLRTRYNDARPKLIELEGRRNELYKTLELRIEQCGRDIRRAVVNYYAKLAEKIPAWIGSYQPVNKPGFSSKEKVRRCTDEVVKFITEKIKENSESWKKEIMEPLMADKIEWIFESTENDLSGVMASIDKVNAVISGTEYEPTPVKGWERALGAGVTALFGVTSGTDMMIQGFNSKSFAKNFAIDLGVSAGISLLALTNPIIALGLLVGMIWRGILSGGAGNLKKVKEGVQRTILESISTNQEEKSTELIDEIKQKLLEIAKQTVSVLDDQLATVRTQTEDAMNAYEAGRETVEKKRALLSNCEKDLQVLSSEISEFVFRQLGLNQQNNEHK